MPLPSDEKLVALSEEILKQFESIFGLHPGFRPAHARGVLLTGTFTASPDASNLTNAPHFASGSTTPITVRFSSAGPFPLSPDTDPQSNPRGLALRFHLGERAHTDIIGHSAPLFPTRTGAEFLELLRAMATSGPGAPSPSPVEAFLGSHPAALKFVQFPKPTPASYAREAYFALCAFKFTNEKGESKFVRYSIIPDAGVEHLPTPPADNANFLYEEIEQRISKASVTYKLVVQIANEGDVVDDITIPWPEDRPQATLGWIKLDKLVPEEAQGKDQKHLIFDPIPRVQGIQPSDDPMLEFRAAVYLISGRRRRAAPEN